MINDDIDKEIIAAENPEAAPVTEEKTGLEPKQALRKAIEEKGLPGQIEKDRPEVEFKKSEKTELKTKEAEIKKAVQEDPAPSEFSAAGRNAWKNKDTQGIQSEYRRIHDERTVAISKLAKERDTFKEEATREKEDAKTWRDLGEMAKPFIEAQGLKGVTPQQAIMNALGLITAFQKSDPATAKAELKAIGIDLDKAPEAKTSAELPKDVLDKIDALQKWKTDTESELEKQKFSGVVQTYQTAYTNLDALKTRTGEKVFPDLLDDEFCSTEEGKQFHAELGSLTKDPIFIKGVFRRFPGADFTVICREAYLTLGGKVTGVPVTVSPENNTKHIERSRRAAGATPGRAAQQQDSSTLKGKLSRKAAIRKAIEIHQEH